MPPLHAVIAVLGVGAVLGGTPASAQPASCERPREAQRRAWGVQAPPREQPPATDGAQVRHWPTATIGTWVVEIHGGAREELTRVGPDGVTRVVFGDDCRAFTTTQARPAARPPVFDDGDLLARLRAGQRGVVHVWSPHMPLSIDAIGALSSAARELGLVVDLVLDPAADRAFAARIADQRGLPASAMRVADSVELTFRDALVHAPSVLVYAGGAIVGAAYPGGHTADEYRAYFTRVLGNR